MRKLLLSAAAAAPLLLLAVGPALADTTVGSGSNQVQTATVNGGSADNVIVGSGAAVTVDGANTSAVVQNSNNTIVNNGTISINATSTNNNTNAVLLNGGFTMPSGTASYVLTNNGTISNTDGYTASTNSTNGFADGAFAEGSDRYGVRLVGSSALVGSIDLAAGTTITVQGNNSYGVSLEAPLSGDFINGGSISITGANSTGLSITAPVGGKVELSGTIDATGTGNSAVNIQSDVTGPLSIYASMIATGYRTTSRNPDATINNELTADQVTQAASTVIIGGNLHAGFFLGSAPAGTNSSDTTTDADNDGIIDSVETAGSITNYGSSPALLIGSTKNIELSVSPYGAQTNTYGVILEGAVVGNGIFDSTLTGATTPVTAFQVGGLGGVTTIDGGISITDTAAVTAQAYQQDAMAIHFAAGATTPLFNNAGAISALSTETVETTATNVTAIQIDAGATLPTLFNSGVINATLTGDTGNAAAIIDKSGTLTSLTNEGTIEAIITPAVDTDTVTGTTVAIDLSKNTSGVTLIQQANPNPVVNPSSSTDSAGDTITFAGTVSPTAPAITGDILLGNGDNTVEFLAGTVKGALSMGSGNSSLTIDNGASYAGALTSGGQMSFINVNNGILEQDSPTTLNVQTLTVGAKGELTVSIDPANNVASVFNVSGQTTLASGAEMNLKMLSLILNGTQTYTVINSPNGLTVGSGTTLTATTPYLFVASFTPQSNDTVDVTVTRRTPAEADLNKAETAAWDPVYENLDLNAGIERAFLDQTDAAGYRAMLNQILPDYAGGVFRALSWANEQQGDAAGDPPLAEDQDGPTRAWSQEIVLDETKNTAQTEPYHILGVGMVAGLESVSPKGDALGMKIGFTTANIVDPVAPGDNLLGVSEFTGGVYWRGKWGGLRLDAQVNAGFLWANDHREFLYTDSIGTIHDAANSNWMGYTLSSRFGIAYIYNFGSFFLEPESHADYFRMHEGGYAETGGGTGFDMQVDPRNGDIFSVTSDVIMGMTFGNTGFRWRPQIEVGYRAVPWGNAGSTTTEFIGGTDPFTLAAETVRMNEAIGRIGMRVYSDYVDVLLDGGIAKSTDYTDLDIHLTARTVF